MKRHYDGITERMLSEIHTISGRMSHPGEKGRNNEFVLADFLRAHLPSRYTVSTGKVVSVGGLESGQLDIIIHDRLDTPAFVTGRAWSLIPIESVFAVISVKTTLNLSELRDAANSLQTVRMLPRKAAMVVSAGRVVPVDENDVLRPRAYVFAFKSDWKEPEGVRGAFVEVSHDIDDALRPNGVCVVEQALVIRRAYTLETVLFSKHPLMHFIFALVRSMDTRQRYMTDLSKYFAEDYAL